MNRRERGFTLMEVLVAMSLFTLLGFAVVALVRSAAEMYATGTRQSVQDDHVAMSLPRLEDDLRHVRLPAQRDRIPFDPKNPDPQKEPEPLPPENRMVSGFHEWKLGRGNFRVRYLAFVRDASGLSELEAYLLKAGTNPKADAWIDGRDDEQEYRENRHLPTGGAVEVLWIFVPDESRPGAGAVHRAFRTPVGGAKTLLDPANHDTPEELRANYRTTQIISDVIHFDLLFWTQYTNHWEWDPGQPSVWKRPQTAAEAKSVQVPCGPSLTWDSTRGIFDAQTFRLSKGADSLRFAADDIWPRRVLVRFALAEEETALAAPLDTNARAFTVYASDFATGRGELFGAPMKVGSEWITLGGRDPNRRDTFRIDRRGVYATTALAHPEDTPVYFGRVLEVAVSIPAFRDDNN